jgi:excisionase family DNA binding protein
MNGLLTQRELAQALSVSPRWIQREMKDGGLPAIHMGSKGRLVRFRLADVLDWAESRSGRDSPADEG